jgi:hypothetical protein
MKRYRSRGQRSDRCEFGIGDARGFGVRVEQRGSQVYTRMRPGESVRVRVEIMGSQKCRIVGKSQSAVVMINPIIFTLALRAPSDACGVAAVCNGDVGYAVNKATCEAAGLSFEFELVVDPSSGEHRLLGAMHGHQVYLEKMHVETRPRKVGPEKVVKMRAFGRSLATMEPRHVDCFP